MIQFRAEGIPVPQGSMKVINGRILHSQGSALAVWRSTIAWSAKQAGAIPIADPIIIILLFTMPRPKTVKRAYPSVAPDLDKLIRASLDALTGVAYLDDGQVVEVQAKKRYGATPGLDITILSQG